MVPPQNFPKSKGESMKTCPQCDTGYPDSQITCPTHGLPLNEIRDLKPGLVIHKTYRIVRKLGQGGMGTVYLAQHIHMGEQRALKFLSHELSSDQALTSRFLREVRTLRQVHSRNVVDCDDLEAAEDDSLFFSMEFVDGPDLRAFLNSVKGTGFNNMKGTGFSPYIESIYEAGPLGPEGSLPVPLALSITRKIAEGLGAAHSKGMVHRDIKPENILMARDAGAWLPKIADFGIVATKESSTAYTRTGGTLLTMAYAAPEQWRGTPAAELDGRTDLYALGGLLYEMLTGQTPFHAENYEGWARQHQTTPPQPPSTLRPDLANWQGLDALTLRLLAKDRNDRPKDVAELLALLDAVRLLPSEAHRETEIDGPATRLGQKMAEESPKLARLSGRWFGFLAGGLILVALALWFTSYRTGQSTDSAVQTTTTVKPQTEKTNQADAVIEQQADSLYNQKRYLESIPLYSTACDKGVIEGCFSLGLMYENGQKGIPKDIVRAVEFYDKACNSGNTDSCINLCKIYHDGNGVRKDSTRAAQLCSKACDAGDAIGCTNLGIMYHFGEGVGRNYLRAAALYSKACDAGNANGCENLGHLYINGFGVQKDIEKGLRLYKMSCSLGEKESCDPLGASDVK
jgi:serine/threonine protein kinase